jgi:hypothetical protein
VVAVFPRDVGRVERPPQYPIQAVADGLLDRVPLTFVAPEALYVHDENGSMPGLM